MAGSKEEEKIALVNQKLRETAGLLRDLNRLPRRRFDTQIEGNLERELERRRLMSNDPE